MVAPQHNHLLGPGYLHRQDEQQHLDGKVAPIHVVPQEDILGGFAITADVGLQ